jgi:thiol-disulfide isomerase/thioredoxin
MIGAVAVGLSFHLDDRLAQFTPGYTSFLQSNIEGNSTASRQLAKIRGDEARTEPPAVGLGTYGQAQDLHPGGSWFNSAPLTLVSLRGKVVLIDFWTYSCINCLRTLPHLEAWDAAYRKDGLVIVGVHTPEFAFEHVASNVAAAVKRLGIRYPVMQDNDYATWQSYGNESWPAEFLIDQQGRLRNVHFGEGSYDETENAIRALLATNGSAAPVADATPTEATTPESYLGYRRLERYLGSPITRNRFANYTFARSLPQSVLSYSGRWRVEKERIVAGSGAKLRLHFFAKDVYLVLGGPGRVQMTIGGKPSPTVDVDSYRLYTLRESGRITDAMLELGFTPGVTAYAFTFG